ncbi:MAG: hypothetical protein M9924_11500 [Rhizobiaceae bacterium]|nr:hypothetical protein [Rhizobiaceae bacterium]
MARMTGREAVNLALRSELSRDRRTVYLGEILRRAGASRTGRGLYDAFGPTQVIETPVSENGFFGAALGLALAGYRPIVEIYTADFLMVVANEVMQDMPKWRQQQNREGPLPITIRGWMGFGPGRGPEHSQCMEAYLHHAPGLTILCPGTPRDLCGLLRAAVRSGEPTVVLEHRHIYDLEQDLPDDDFVTEIGKGEIVCEGTDVTVVAWSWMRQQAQKAAEKLAEQGVSVEVIDPRTIKPMDFDLIQRSVEKTGRLLVAEESPITGNVGAEIIARVSESSARPVLVRRLAMEDVIHPYDEHMEMDLIPDATDIVAAVHAIVAAAPEAGARFPRASALSHGRLS